MNECMLYKNVDECVLLVLIKWRNGTRYDTLMTGLCDETCYEKFSESGLPRYKDPEGVVSCLILRLPQSCILGLLMDSD